MHILVTGANGYIGSRLIPSLIDQGHMVTCLVRDPRRFVDYPHHRNTVRILQGDLLDTDSLSKIPKDIDAAFYLVHSMSTLGKDFGILEAICAENFANAISETNARQIIYLSGIGNDDNLSVHLQSRIRVEEILRAGKVPVTVLRAAIIIGSGSASFEILRDLVEKLPAMITPRWVKNRCQPIAIADVIYYLQEVMYHPKALGQTYDIGGPDILTYRDMMMLYAKIRGLKRLLVSVPVLTPRLSSYWLYFITATSFSLAKHLVDSLRNEVVCGQNHINKLLKHKPLSFEDALKRALSKIENKQVLSSWKDSMISGNIRPDFLDFVEVPQEGVFKNVQTVAIDNIDGVRDRVWSIGGKQGWYHMNWAWQLRGYLDTLCGGVGLRRGRRDPQKLRIGDALDFWRVLLTTLNRDQLVLFAEMKLPGEAWLAFRFYEKQGTHYLEQTATFRPRGIFGRLYWHSLSPIHFFIFKGMINAIVGENKKPTPEGLNTSKHASPPQAAEITP